MKINNYQECEEAILAIREFVVENNKKQPNNDKKDALVIGYVHTNGEDHGFHGVLTGPAMMLTDSLLHAYKNDRGFRHLLGRVCLVLNLDRITDGALLDEFKANEVRHED